MILSADQNWGIGREGKLLFWVREDMAYFKKMTVGKVVVMGRKTFESLPGQKPLQDRVNIVLTSGEGYAADGAVVCHSLPALFKALKAYRDGDVFVIGGAAVYRMLLPYCDTAYITRFLAAEPADRFVPDFDRLPGWKLVSNSGEMHENGVFFRFDEYRNENPELIK